GRGRLSAANLYDARYPLGSPGQRLFSRSGARPAGPVGLWRLLDAGRRFGFPLDGTARPPHRRDRTILMIQSLSRPSFASSARALFMIAQKDWQTFWRYPLNAIGYVM